MPPKKLSIFGVKIDSLSLGELMEFISDCFKQQKTCFIVTVNGEILLKAEKDLNYRRVLQEADLKIVDSTNVSIVSWLKGKPIKEIIPGSSLSIEIARLAALKSQSLYLLGAKEGVARQAADQLKSLFPNLIISGTSSKNPDDPTVVDDINQAKPDIIFVAYGAPKQELWINSNRHKIQSKLFVGVGGTFDMLAGTLPRAPKLMQTIHLEWFWRLILQPSRIGRIWKALVIFPIKAILS